MSGKFVLSPLESPMPSFLPHLFLCDSSGSIADEDVEKSIYPAIHAKRSALEAGESGKVFVCFFTRDLHGTPVEITEKFANDPARWGDVFKLRNGGTDIKHVLQEVLSNGFIENQQIGQITIISDLLDISFNSPFGAENPSVEVEFIAFEGADPEQVKTFADGVSSWASVATADFSVPTAGQEPSPSRAKKMRPR